MENQANNNDQDRNKTLDSFGRLLTIMDELREKCPWDRKQTFDTLRYLTIEETYELSDAILDKNYSDIKKELGDLALHIVFYAKIASEENHFTIQDVFESLIEKLISRHPHIYGDAKAENEEDVKRNWEQLKLKEKGGNKTVLGGVPKTLPALVKAMRIQEKARSAGFDWEKKEQVWQKVEEELEEFKDEFNIADGKEIDKARAQGEFGDLLFSLVNYARFLDINPEDALEHTNRKFIQRFNFVEKESAKDGKRLPDMTLAEMDIYWETAKRLFGAAQNAGEKDKE
jgi:MazG family protein